MNSNTKSNILLGSKRKAGVIQRDFQFLGCPAESQVLLKGADIWHVKSFKHTCKHNHKHLPAAINIQAAASSTFSLTHMESQMAKGTRHLHHLNSLRSPLSHLYYTL